MIVAFRCNYFRTLCEISPSVLASVIAAFRCNYFRTLCEISPSVLASVIVAFRSNYFRTLCEMLTDWCPSVLTSVIVQCIRGVVFVFSIYLPAKNSMINCPSHKTIATVLKQ